MITQGISCLPVVFMMAWQPLLYEVEYAKRNNVVERGNIKRSVQNTDYLQFSPLRSMVATLHNHITSLTVIVVFVSVI